MNEKIYDKKDSRIRVYDLRKFIAKKAVYIFAITLIFGLIGLLFSIIQKPKYVAQSTFIIEEKQNTLGSLSGLASQFGFDISSVAGGGPGIFSGDNILEILKSKKIIKQVLLSKQSTGQDKRTLADVYVEINNKHKKWRKTPLEGVSFAHGAITTPIQDSALNIIYDELIKKNIAVERTNRKGTIIKLTVSSNTAAFSIEMNNRIIEEAHKLYVQIKTKNSQENILKLQARSDSLLRLLNSKTVYAAGTIPVDINPGLKSTMVLPEIASRDKSIVATIYAEVTKNLEASKLIMSQQQPVIQILDQPGTTLFDNKKSTVFIIITACAMGLVFSVAYFLILYTLTQWNNYAASE